MNTIRLTKAQRAEAGVEVEQRVLIRTRAGCEYFATVKTARRHDMERGLHADDYAPCDVHEGPTPRPQKIKVRRIKAAA